MATVDTLPERQIAESGDHAVGRDGSAGELARFPLRTAASHNVGVGTDNVPRVADFRAGITITQSAKWLAGTVPPAGVSSRYLRIMPVGSGNFFVGDVIGYTGTTASRACSEFDIRIGTDATGTTGSVRATFRAGSPSTVNAAIAKIVQLVHEGQTWLAVDTNTLSGLHGTQVTVDAKVSATFDPAWIKYIPQGEESAVVPAVVELSAFAGAPGDAIQNFSPLRNTAVADMSVATDFQVLEKQTWTPRIEGAVTPGTQTYARQVGFFWRYGKQYYFTFEIELTALDPATDGAVLIRGAPEVADATVAEHMATFSRVHNITIPANTQQFLPHYVPQGGLRSVRVSILRTDGSPSNLFASALTNTTQIFGAFSFTVP